MKTYRSWVSLLAMAFSVAASGQTLTNRWTVMDGGGGTSTRDSLTLSSSIGQPIVSVSAGSGSTLEGGYLPGARMFSGASITPQSFVLGGWNLISVPVASSNQKKVTLYPSSISSAFAYLPAPIGYAVRDTLQVGVGYWLKFDSSQSIEVTGTATNLDTLDLNAGWNMIGTLAYPVLESSITPLPPLALSSLPFGFRAGVGYQPEDTLKPGFGYWLKVSQAGRVILSPAPMIDPGAPTISERARPSDRDADSPLSLSSSSEMTSIHIRDDLGNERSVYFSGQPVEARVRSFELPPVPPSGILDVRFASQRWLEAPTGKRDKAFPIIVQGASFPIEVSWSRVAGSGGAIIEAAFAGVPSRVFTLEGNGSLKIEEKGFIGLTLRYSAVDVIAPPANFALYQNYPNPFNPTTRIQYDVPRDAIVSLKVYNLLGEEIVNLVSEEKRAGRYSVSFDAEYLPSGVYFYRLQASDYFLTKKLILTK